jgi:peptidoglycan hydrolase-like protein with peptidoglycan-binding domain
MIIITASVGRGGKNRLDDVRSVQELLNRHRSPSQTPVGVDGLMNSETIAAIEEFQKRIVDLAAPDGRVDPDGKTFKALVAGQPLASPVSPLLANLSGAAWWHANQARFPNSRRIEDLEPNFRARTLEFLAALKTADANVNVAATLRNQQRVYLMHYSFKIAHDSIKPSQVPNEPGVNIVWNHGDTEKSKTGAQEMVDLFEIVFQPSLTSRHITGNAIDMDITWTGTLTVRNKTGQTVQIGAPRDGSENTQLHSVGASYGVIKLIADKPHWSSDGH